MKMLVIGSGGREHALVFALKTSPSVTKLYCSPGNAGIAQDAECITLVDQSAILKFCHENRIDLVAIGPEQPLVEGLADTLEENGVRVFGPSAAAAKLEGSKGFMKDLCHEYNIPTAAYGVFRETAPAKTFLRQFKAPYVIKADGLAAGKGVVIAGDLKEAEETIDEMLGGKFGEASASIVIEEFMEGEEVSFFALCDGETAIPFGSAQDHKKVGDGDTGPNTGGMGTYSPALIMTAALEAQVMRDIINPTLKAMKARGTPYKGVLFAGLMITKSGPKLLEYNVRFGDPETQVLMLRLKSDLAQLMQAVAEGKLSGQAVTLYPHAAVCVVMASKGYPGDYQKGTEIRNLDKAQSLGGVTVFHAGTAIKDGKLIATGGRVLGVCATGVTIKEAQAQAYRAVDLIDWPEGFCRRDIARRAVA